MKSDRKYKELLGEEKRKDLSIALGDCRSPEVLSSSSQSRSVFPHSNALLDHLISIHGRLIVSNNPSGLYSPNRRQSRVSCDKPWGQPS